MSKLAHHALIIVALMSLASVPIGCASAVREAKFDIELNACVDSSETQAEYDECKEQVKEKYNVD